MLTKAHPSTLIPRDHRDQLAAWFGLYMKIEAGPQDSNTFKAKRRDLQEFLDYYLQKTGADHPDKWTRSVTQAFLRYLRRERRKQPDKAKNLAPESVNRMLATLKHAARWIHRQRPFLAGFPCDRVQELLLDDPEWKGLSAEQVQAVKQAAEELIDIRTRKNQDPLRDYAMLLLLLHTALRVSELISLDVDQFDGSSLRNIQRKGKRVTRRLVVAKPAREAIDRYLEESRGGEVGPLFLSRNGQVLAPQNIEQALSRIADQANQSRPKRKRIHLTPHVLRHTCLRRAAEEHGIQYAMELSGHTSSKYIWRYIKPSEQEFDDALEELF